MLGAVQSLSAGSLLSMAVNGQCGHSQSPSIGLRQGCALSATLCSIFIDGLHHHSQTTAAAAGVRVWQWQLTDLVWANDICLLASSPQHLQALIDALVGYHATLHMEISVAKTKVVVVSNPFARSPTSAAAVVTCNGHQAERVNQVPGSALSCIRRHVPPDHPSEGKGGRLLGCGAAKAFSAAVWQHSQPQTLPVAKHPGIVSALRL